MNRRTHLSLAALLLTVAVSAFAQPPQKPPDAKTKPTGVIRGRVTAADTGRPLRRAQVFLSAPDAGERRTASTNSVKPTGFRI